MLKGVTCAVGRMAANDMASLAQAYVQRRLGNDVEGCVALLDEKVTMDSSHGCDAGMPAVGLPAVRERLVKHPPPKIPVVWTKTTTDEMAKTVVLNGSIKQFRMTWYQKLELEFTAEQKIKRVYWYGQIPVRDGEGCCV